MNPEGVARIFRALGVDVPNQSRLQSIADSGRSASKIRDDLLAWGKKQGGNTYREMLRTYVSQYTNDSARINRIADEIIGGRKIDEVRKTFEQHGATAGTPSYGTTPGEPGTGGGSGSIGSPGGVLAGGQTIKVGRQYYQVYQFPPGSGNFVSYQFNNLEQAQKALGKNFAHVSRSQSWFNQRVLAQASAEEVIGQSGNWTQLTRNIMRDAAEEAGVRDPGLIGRMMSNKEMQQIMAQAMIGEWSPQQILAAQRKTSFWQNELYPGIANLYQHTSNPEEAWLEYRGSVSSALETLGYQRDANGTFNKQIERMLKGKISSDAFLAMVPTFVQATQNAEFAAVLNEWARRDLGRNIRFDDWFGLMAGESQPELEDIAERAQLAWVAQNQGVGVTQQQIRNLGARTQMSQAEMQAAFADFNRGVLALGEDGLARGGLTRDEVLSAAAGIDAGTGRSVEEIKLQIAKVARENALFDDEKINFFIGFTPGGTPHRPGLQALSPEGA